MDRNSKNPCTCCGKCCGSVIANGREFRIIEKYAATHNVTPIRQGITCPWFQNQRCQVYEARPMMCRLFGRVQGMKCPEEGVSFVQLSRGNEARTMDRYATDCRTFGSRFLHEAAFSIEEIQALHEEYLASPDKDNGTVPLALLTPASRV